VGGAVAAIVWLLAAAVILGRAGYWGSPRWAAILHRGTWLVAGCWGSALSSTSRHPAPGSASAGVRWLCCWRSDASSSGERGVLAPAPECAVALLAERPLASPSSTRRDRLSRARQGRRHRSPGVQATDCLIHSTPADSPRTLATRSSAQNCAPGADGVPVGGVRRFLAHLVPAMLARGKNESSDCLGIPAFETGAAPAAVADQKSVRLGATDRVQHVRGCLETDALA
jgi:hypothetical protein